MTEIVHRWDSGLIDLAQFAREIGPLRNISADDVIRIHDAYLLGPFDGAAELIDELNASGLKTACLSNTNAGHWQLMNARGGPNFLPLDRMTYRFASHLIGCCKPANASNDTSKSRLEFADGRSCFLTIAVRTSMPRSDADGAVT
jgi:hypothetical protein